LAFNTSALRLMGAGLSVSTLHPCVLSKTLA
jgi:hypothetical protein